MNPSPIVSLHDPTYAGAGVEVFLKRDDLVGGLAHGNKWRKLKYLVRDAMARRRKTLITFGGPFSNHLVATAWVARKYGLASTGFVRGEIDPDNPVLALCRQMEMDLLPTTRDQYNHYRSTAAWADLVEKWPSGYIIPEGGASALAIQGAEELGREILNYHVPFTHWGCCYGTGTTISGLAQAAQNTTDPPQILSFRVVKGQLREKLPSHVLDVQADLGGFGKFPTALITYIRKFSIQHRICLDPVYTGKMMFAFEKMVKDGGLDRGSKILLVHSGGYPGIIGYNYRFSAALPAQQPDRYAVLLD